MATYFNGNPDIQAASASAEGLQTLVLMNPTYVQFPDANSPTNLLFLNSGPPLGGISAVSHLFNASPTTSTQQFVGLPLDANANDLHGILPRLQYNLYNTIEQSSPARETPRAQQGLSLSLSSQQRSNNYQRNALPPHPPGYASLPSEDIRVSGGSVSSGSGMSNGVSGLLSSSKYLKAVQDLLDEVVSVNRNLIKSELPEKKIPSSEKVAGDASAGDGEGIGKRGKELTNAERQEIQMQKAKLVGMLDEVEQRYRQYDHQMQILKSSFEQAAGIGSANTYTALALGTISKQFKCLKDAIVTQIKFANNTLGEEEKPEGSRLKYVDHHYRQQRALQQLGMIHHNAWRPQRGLPERSVSVLRAWLFEHFLHPYPKDSDKHMLAKQTGLTRSQVSNWFINARVRLWKPMVEEMYLEEIKAHEKNSSESKDKSSGDEKVINQQCNPSASMSTGASEQETTLKKPRNSDLLQSLPFSSSTNMDVKPGDASSEHMTKKYAEEWHSRDGFSFLGGFGQYPIEDIGRFDGGQFAPRFSGNGVSLTLGLPNQELISLSASHHNFLPSQSMQLGRRMEVGNPEFGSLSSPTPHSAAAFDSINSIQSRKRFAAQLLPTDFVA